VTDAEQSHVDQAKSKMLGLDDMGAGAVSHQTGVTLELLQGAQNLVKYARIGEAQEVAILASRGQHEDVINALVIASEEQGAHVTVIETRGRTERHAFPGLREEPPRVLRQALKGADIFIDAGIGPLYAVGARHVDREYMKVARSEYGAIFIRSEMLSREVMASEFGRLPCDVVYEIGRRVLSIVEQGKAMRVTTPLGTDISFEINPRGIMGSFRPLNMPGDMLAIPGGRVGLNPEHGYGILYSEAVNPKVEPPYTFMTKPIKIVWDDNWAVEISGEGESTEWLSNLIDRRGDRNARWWGECMFGIHPKSNAFGYPTEDVEVYFTGLHSRPDTLHNALGHSAGAGGVVSNLHIDTFVHDQTVYVDGEKLIDDGHLLVLDDPGIREFASRYGDPDDLLRMDPMPEGLFKCERGNHA